jgi:hypothetical protein
VCRITPAVTVTAVAAPKSQEGWSVGATRATCSALKSAGSATVTSSLGALLFCDVIDVNVIGGWAA